MMCRRDSPRSFTPGPTSTHDLVAITTSSRLPASARPRIRSAGSRSAAGGAPGRSKVDRIPYTLAVSKKLMPRSSAAWTTRSASRSIGATPNVAVPTQILETFTPVDPRRAYSISQPRLPSASPTVVRRRGPGAAMNLRRVEEGNTTCHRRPHQADNLLPISGIGPAAPAHAHAAEADCGYLKAAAEWALPHALYSCLLRSRLNDRGI